MDRASADRPERHDVPLATRQHVLMEAGYKCANPACRQILTLDIHHIEWVRDGGGNDPGNLLALCPNCHALHTRGHIPAAAIRHWKGMLVALNHAFDRHSMDLLLFLSKQGGGTWYTADGTIAFAGLIAAGLAAFGTSVMATQGNVPESRHQIRLSERGRLLLEAWVNGDEDEYRRLLGPQTPADQPGE